MFVSKLFVAIVSFGLGYGLFAAENSAKKSNAKKKKITFEQCCENDGNTEACHKDKTVKQKMTKKNGKKVKKSCPAEEAMDMGE